MIKFSEMLVKRETNSTLYNVAINNVKFTAGGLPSLSSHPEVTEDIVLFNEDGSKPDLTDQANALQLHLNQVKKEIAEAGVPTLVVDQLCKIEYPDEATAVVTLAYACTTGVSVQVLFNDDETLENGRVRRKVRGVRGVESGEGLTCE